MIMSVSTLMIFNGAATPSSVVNFSIGQASGYGSRQGWFIASAARHQGQKRVSVLRKGGGRA
jgi:hypothetical protein